MAKAEQAGIVEIDGIPRRIRAGDEIPEGATVRQSETPEMGRRARQPKADQQGGSTPEQEYLGATQPEKPAQTDAEKRAKGPAPENRGKP